MFRLYHVVWHPSDGLWVSYDATWNQTCKAAGLEDVVLRLACLNPDGFSLQVHQDSVNGKLNPTRSKRGTPEFQG